VADFKVVAHNLPVKLSKITKSVRISDYQPEIGTRCLNKNANTATLN
jgi:hypothetical protein